MNWKLIFCLSLGGIALGLAKSYAIVPEPAITWIPYVAVLAMTAIIAKKAHGKYFLHGFLACFFASLFVAATEYVLWDEYAAHNFPVVSQYMAISSQAGMLPKEMNAILTGGIGVMVSVSVGVLTLIVSMIVGTKKVLPLRLGISLVVIGVAAVIISQTVPFTHVEHNEVFSYNVPDNDSKNAVLFIGIVAFIAGGLFIAKGIKNSQSANASPIGTSGADELLKLKNLLDQGAITQTEYDEQKKKILS